LALTNLTSLIVNVTGNISEIDSIFKSITDAEGEFNNVISKAQSEADQYNSYRSAAVNVSFVLAFLTALLGVLGALFNSGKLCLYMGLLGILTLFFVCVSFGLHLPTSVLVADVCIAINTFLSDPSIQIPQGLNLVLECIQNSTYQLPIKVGNELVNYTLSSINSQTQQCCGITVTWQNITNLNISALPQAYQSKVQTAVEAYNEIVIIINDLDDLINCSIIREGFDSMEFAICVTLLRGLDLIMAAQGLSGIVLIPGCILAIIGWKRFPNPEKKRKKEVPQTTENTKGNDQHLYG